MTVATEARNAIAFGTDALGVVVVLVVVGGPVVLVGPVVEIVTSTVLRPPVGATDCGAADCDVPGEDAHPVRTASATAIAVPGVAPRDRCIVLRLPTVRRILLVAVFPVVALVACGGATARRPAAPSTLATTTTSTAAAPSTAGPRRTPVAPSTAPVATAPVTTAARVPVPAPTVPPPPPTTVQPPPPGPVRAQLIVVDASGYDQSIATFDAFEQTSAGWVRRFGPWSARIGRNGFAPADAKREGDGRTPSGSYGFSFFFGIAADPGVRYPYRHITTSAFVWDDDPNSASYNEWIDTRVADAGVRPEPMYDAPSYDYGAVIAYNTGRTPGLGSTIFLHVSNGTSTAGCVALPVSELLDVLRWLNPSANPQIRLGVDVPAPA